jgi:DnaK suppressor protein
MDSQELKFFKELLLNQRSEILNKTASLRNDTLIEGNVQGDEADLAVSEQSLEQQLRFQQRDSQHLQKIDYSLGRIEEGSFGMCEQCEEPLDRKRLIARPVANLCVACKEDQESQERRFA